MNKIDSIREKKGMSYADIAKATGLTATYIWSLAKGKKQNPTLENIKKISKALDSKAYVVFNLE